MNKSDLLTISLGIITVILIIIGFWGTEKAGFLESVTLGVNDQALLSSFIAVFVLFSIGILVFAKEWLMYFSGILFGFSIAGLVGGYSVSLFLLVFFFSNELRKLGKIHSSIEK